MFCLVSKKTCRIVTGTDFTFSVTSEVSRPTLDLFSTNTGLNTSVLDFIVIAIIIISGDQADIHWKSTQIPRIPYIFSIVIYKGISVQIHLLEPVPPLFLSSDYIFHHNKVLNSCVLSHTVRKQPQSVWKHSETPIKCLYWSRNDSAWFFEDLCRLKKNIAILS